MLFSSSLIFSTGCSLFNSSEQPLHNTTLVLPYSYDKVWRASQVTMSQYPIERSSPKTGVISTKEVRGNEVWEPPFPSKQRGGYRYHLTLNLVRGKRNGKKVVRVQIEKKPTFKKNFFSERKRIKSDYYEEQALLYKIRRELYVENLLEKANK